MSPNVQRIGILVIAIVMIIGTLGSFAILVLGTNNQMEESERLQKEQQRAADEQQKKVNELSAKYYPVFKEYKGAPAAFDAESVGDKVTHKDLKDGTGDVITKDSTYIAYYIGWNPKGVELDSSFSGDSLKQPLPVSPTSLIPGWYDGVDGMKVGGVREITLPSEFAYGEAGSGDKIPPNTPIKFIVFIPEKS